MTIATGYDISAVRALGTLRLPTTWGLRAVTVTDDGAYDNAGYVTLPFEGQDYFVPGFIVGEYFHVDITYAQQLPEGLLKQACYPN